MATDSSSDHSARPLVRPNLRRAILGATIGNAIEFYDFTMYGVVAPLVFPKIFFPAENPYTGVLLVFSAWFIGFVARPMGALLFGHLGDRIGRKKTLLCTMSVIGVGTVGIGLLPSYHILGPVSAFLLVALRLLQGLAFGGEWGGSNLLAMESGSRRRRGFLTSFSQGGVMVGLFIANIFVFAMNRNLTPASFMAWGWRVPFLASAVLVVVGIWIRLKLVETAVFREVQATGRVERIPVRAVFRQQPMELLLCTLLKVAEMVPVFIFITFVFTYGAETLKYGPDFLTVMVAGAALVAALAMPIVGHLSDRIGHERMYQLGAAAMLIFGFLYFAGLGTRSAVVAAVCIVVSLVPYAMMFGSEGAILGKTFGAAWRYTGSSLAYNLAGIIGGGPAPFIATWLLALTGSAYAIASYIAIACLTGFVAVTILRRRALAAAGSRGTSGHGESPYPDGNRITLTGAVSLSPERGGEPI